METKDNHYSGNLIPEAFREHINQYWRIGKYLDPEGTELDLLVVEVKNLTKLDRARTALRNFAINRLRQFEKDYSLIAFYAKDDGGEDWRFSFVKIEHGTFQDAKGKVKLKTELTPAKRYSYLVGVHENSHTAQNQLLDLLIMDYANPKIEDIEKAFSIEKVTTEFFEQYKGLYLVLSEQLKWQPFFSRGTDEENKQNLARFAKKLLGQIVFLYFLQKKGWLGVEQGQAWGKGPRDFMRQRFKQTEAAGGNYYHDFLQFLFYEALAQDRKDQTDPNYYSRFACKIPFLNGGLFEAEYDWETQTIDLPDSLFHNSEKNKEGDDGTGILDIFNRYNFTIKEDEPLEKEVAVDPEMLGKVFENMLDDTERKSKGAFYTPREIVHYMCQESLIHYLDNSVNSSNEKCSQRVPFDPAQGDASHIPKVDIETLIHKGHLFVENDAAALQALQRIQNGEQKTTKQKIDLPESVKVNAKLIDDKLANIKICDPAIGSGAFPVGLLHEIVTARLALAPHSGNQGSTYDLKRHTIGESLYGVDIDPSAIDIARLRLWLSLIVDEDDFSRSKALPNLDYKIMQGNSLVEEYWGVKLFNEDFINDDDGNEAKIQRLKERRKLIDFEHRALLEANQLNDDRNRRFEKEAKSIDKKIIALRLIPKGEDPRIGMFDTRSESKKKASQLEWLHKEFFSACSPEKKKEIRQKITTLEWELIEATLVEQGQLECLEKLKPLKESGEKPFFLWKLNFPEVFKEKGGFDVVIGNPPYMIIQTLTKAFPDLVQFYKGSYFTATGKFDIYCLFTERGTELLNSSGTLNYIMPSKWTASGFGKGLRQYISEKKVLKKFISFGSFQVFNASTYTSLLWLSKQSGKNAEIVLLGKNLLNASDLGNWLNYEDGPLIEIDKSKLNENPWILSSNASSVLLDKILRHPPVSNYLDGIFQGIVTGDNDAFLLHECNYISEIAITGFSKALGQRVTVELKAVRPYLYGKTIGRHSCNFDNTYIIYPYQTERTGTRLISENILKEDFPQTYAYFSKIRDRLKDRGSSSMKYPSWYSLWNQRTIQRLSAKNKILTPDVCHGGSMWIDRSGLFFHSDTTYAIIVKSSFINLTNLLYAVLNSSVLWFYLINTGAVQRGGYFRFKTSYLKPFPLPSLSDAIIDALNIIVSYIEFIFTAPNKLPLVCKYFDLIADFVVLELYFPTEIKAAGKEILMHLGNLIPITDTMTNEEKLAVIQTEFDRLYDPSHLVRNHLETLDSVEEVRIIREALKR